MNGRVYDNVIGQFISADAVPDLSQGTDAGKPFGYVANNSFVFSDPTG